MACAKCISRTSSFRSDNPFEQTCEQNPCLWPKCRPHALLQPSLLPVFPSPPIYRYRCTNNQIMSSLQAPTTVKGGMGVQLDLWYSEEAAILAQRAMRRARSPSCGCRLGLYWSTCPADGRSCGQPFCPRPQGRLRKGWAGSSRQGNEVQLAHTRQTRGIIQCQLLGLLHAMRKTMRGEKPLGGHWILSIVF